jgi:hypothetical protein
MDMIQDTRSALRILVEPNGVLMVQQGGYCGLYLGDRVGPGTRIAAHVAADLIANAWVGHPEDVPDVGATLYRLTPGGRKVAAMLGLGG